MNLKNFQVGALIREASLVVSVAKKGDRRGRVQQAIERLRGSENIFVLVVKCSVNEHNAVCGQRTLRQRG
jgi:hypothetical protein